jgi:large subunit ribosomal protein L9
MKVILTAKSKLGNIGDVVTVKNGYAKNFLIPNNKAICLTKQNQELFNNQQQFYQQQNSNNLELANKIKSAVANQNIIIIENASDDGHLYGSVNSATIAKKINGLHSTKLGRNNIVLQKPIKEIGIYQVSIDLHSEVEIIAKVVVSRSESEVSAMLSASQE